MYHLVALFQHGNLQNEGSRVGGTGSETDNLQEQLSTSQKTDTHAGQQNLTLTDAQQLCSAGTCSLSIYTLQKTSILKQSYSMVTMQSMEFGTIVQFLVPMLGLIIISKIANNSNKF